MAIFAGQSKSSSTFSNESKNVASFSQFLRHGKEPTVDALANIKFTDVVFDTGEVLKDLTFEQLGNILWSNLTKN